MTNKLTFMYVISAVTLQTEFRGARAEVQSLLDHIRSDKMEAAAAREVEQVVW